MKEIERHTLTKKQVVTAITNYLNKDLAVGTFIHIAKIWDKRDGWKIIGGLIEE